MAEIEEYTREIVERAKTFEYEDLYAKDEPLGPCPLCGRPVFETPWFYRCRGEARARSRLSAAHLEGHVRSLHRPQLGAHAAERGQDRRARRLHRAQRPHLPGAARDRPRGVAGEGPPGRVGRGNGTRGPRVRGQRGAAGRVSVRRRVPRGRVADPVHLRAQAEGDGSRRRRRAPQELRLHLAAHGVQARDHARRGDLLRHQQAHRAAHRLHVALRPARSRRCWS